MATASEVDRTLKQLVKRLDEASLEPGNLPEKRSLVVFIRDLDITYTAVFGGGRITALKKRDAEGDEDVRISLSSDDLASLANGKLGVGGALLTGRLRVDAGARDLLLLRQLF